MNFPLPLFHSAPLKDTKDLLIVNFSSHFSIFTLLDLSATMSYVSLSTPRNILFIWFPSSYTSFIFILHALSLCLFPGFLYISSTSPSYTLCGSPCKIKMWVLLLKN